jgi:ABC-type bacteriocin/lantibiotic exporter with double-glycine peptidase domain
MRKNAKAGVVPIRQRTQYSCMAASMTMCLQAHGVKCDEDVVNDVLGATPMRGAAWEQALACAQHYGFRATLVCPSTVSQMKSWTDAGDPIIIAWNPEGRDWSHASVVFDIDDNGDVYVADPNIPDPEETVRVVPKDEFYKKWYEKFPNYLVRRPACVIQREITSDGKQVFASETLISRVARKYHR